MKKNMLYYFAGLVLLCSSCKKTDIDLSGLSWGGWGGFIINSNELDTAGLSNIRLPFDRYFIYKDSASGTPDSVRVTSSQSIFNTVASTGNTPIHGYYNFELILRKFPGGDTWYSGLASCDSDYHTIPVFYDGVFDLIDKQISLPSFWYPFTSSGNRQYTNIPAMTIEGIPYTNVHSFAASNGLAPSDINYIATVFYWVKGIGIVKRVKKTFSNVSSHSLLRYG